MGSDSPRRTSLRSSSPLDETVIKWIFVWSCLLRTIWLFYLFFGKRNEYYFERCGHPLHWVSAYEFLTRLNSPAPQSLQAKHILSKLISQTMRIEWKFYVSFSFKLITLSQKYNEILSLNKKKLLILWMTLQIVVHTKCSYETVDLERFSDISIIHLCFSSKQY